MALSKKRALENDPENAQGAGGDFASVQAEIEELKVNLANRDALIERLKTEVVVRAKALAQKEEELSQRASEAAAAPPAETGAVNEQAVRNAITACRTALTAKDAEINELKENLSRFDVTIISLKEQNRQLEAALKEQNRQLEAARAEEPKKSAMPDMRIIESVYMRAFDGAKAIAQDAKETMKDLANQVFLELNGDISRAAGIHEELLGAKRTLHDFINQGAEHFRALERIIVNIAETNVNTTEHMRRLSASRDNIIEKIDEVSRSVELELNNKNEISAPAAAQPARVEAPVFADIYEPVKEKSPPEDFDPGVFSFDSSGENIEDLYNSEDALGIMKEAIRKSLEQREAPPALAAGFDFPGPDAALNDDKSKVNIQDILKKYSTLN